MKMGTPPVSIFGPTRAYADYPKYHDVRHISFLVRQFAVLSLLIVPPKARGKLHARFLMLRHDTTFTA